MWRYEDPSLTPSKDTFSIYSETGHRRRKSHTKSQNGCNVCRRRRIKCSEERPTCNHCSRLRKTCLYRSPCPKQLLDLRDPCVDLALLTPIVKTHIWTALTSNNDLDPDLITYSPLIKCHANECLDHFFRCDRPWLKHPHIQKVMQRSTTHQVLGNPYLLYAALAVSAAHLATLRPSHDPYGTLSLVLWQKSLRVYQPCLLGKLESQNADALFFAGHLHSMLASVNAHRQVHDQCWRVPVWVLSLRGIKALWDMPSVIAQLRQGIWQHWVEVCTREYQQVSEDLAASDSSSQSCITHSLGALCNPLSPEEKDMFSDRIRVLQMLQGLHPSPEATNLLSWFITRAPPEFISRLEDGKGLALLLLLYWFHLASRLGQWWLSLAAEAEFERLYTHLSNEGEHGSLYPTLEAIKNQRTTSSTERP